MFPGIAFEDTKVGAGDKGCQLQVIKFPGKVAVLEEQIRGKWTNSDSHA